MWAPLLVGEQHFFTISLTFTVDGRVRDGPIPAVWGFDDRHVMDGGVVVARV